MALEYTEGLIIKALSGFYYVDTPLGLITCHARGVFRNRGQEVYVGDTARVELTGGDTGYVVEVGERKNFLLRPPLANLDQLVMVISTCEPAPNLLIIDRLIAIAERKRIEPFLVFTKMDKADSGKLACIYRSAGFAAAEVSNTTGEGMEAVRAQLVGKLSTFCGNSGVGKSSLLNRLDEHLAIPTAEISHKLGRGKHTTRHVELFPLAGGGWVADTPGFSSLDLERCEPILKEGLADCFREFTQYENKCKYTGCSHTQEKGCAILEALAKGEIEPTRHASYLAMYAEVKNLKEWELK